MKYKRIILLACVLLMCFSTIETAVAQDDIDWNKKPWLDPRVIKCVREYLDKVVIPVNEERRRNNQAPYWRFDDWGRSVNEYSTPDPRGVDGPWDNPTHFVWGFFKSTHFGGVQNYVKECVRKAGGGPPSLAEDDAPPPPARDDKCCEEYASLAVCQQRLNIERDCGFTDPPARWHLNYQVHYNWCLGVAEAFADSETRARQNQLRKCIGRQR